MKAITINLFLAVSMIAFNACTVEHNSSGNKNPTPPENSQVAEVIGLINSCPSWWDSYPPYVFNDEMQLKLEACLKKISEYDTESIRQAISSYYSHHLSEGTFEANEKGKIYILIRYVFNISIKDKRIPDLPAEVGWFNPGKEENILWPLSEVDEEGNIKIGNRAALYTGQRYLPLEEFDYFNKRFGRRQIKTSLGRN